MNSITLGNVLKHNKFTKKYFRGVYASNTLPLKPKPASILIANTDKAHLPGIHWVGFFIPPKKPKNLITEFFDSYGRAPTRLDFLKFLRRTGAKEIYYNPMQIQSNNSESCGQITCLYLLHKSKNKSLKTFLKLFSRDLKHNELVVKELFKKNFALKPAKKKRNKK